MKKLVSGFLFIVIPLLLAIPGFMGWKTETHMMATANYINSLPEYKARWKSYERGWFNSKGVLLLELDGINQYLQAEEPITLPVNLSLAHGPFITSPTIGVGWFSANIELLKKHEATLKQYLTVEQEGPLYQLQASMSLVGITRFYDRWLPFSFQLDKSQLVMKQAYQGEGSIGLDRSLSYTMLIPEISVLAGDEALYVERLSGDMTLDLTKLQASRIAPGMAIVQMASIETRSAELKIEGLKVLAETWLDSTEKYLGSRATTTIDRLSNSDINVSDAVLEIAYTNISLEFIEKYQAAMKSLPENAPPHRFQEVIGRLVLSSLLPFSPKLEITRFNAATDRGHIKSQFSLSIEGEALAQASVNPQSPLDLLPFMLANFKGEISEPLGKELARLYIRQQVESQLAQSDQIMTEQELTDVVNAQAPSIIEMLSLQGFVKLQGDSYISELKYQKGQATLNGEPMPLPF